VSELKERIEKVLSGLATDEGCDLLREAQSEIERLERQLEAAEETIRDLRGKDPYLAELAADDYFAQKKGSK
jgi:cell division protein FtsB